MLREAQQNYQNNFSLLRGEYIFVDKQTQLDLTRIHHSLPATNSFLMGVTAYKTEFHSIFLYIASRCNIFLKQIHGVKINCCKALCFLPYFFFRENQGIVKSTMPYHEFMGW